MELRLGRTGARLAQDLVGLPKLPVLALQRLHLRSHVLRHAGTPAGIDLGLLHPLVQRRARAADLCRDRNDRCPAGRMLMFVIQHQPYRALPHFRGELVRRLAHRCPILSGVGASGKTGAVHSLAGRSYPDERT